MEAQQQFFEQANNKAKAGNLQSSHLNRQLKTYMIVNMQILKIYRRMYSLQTTNIPSMNGH